MATRMPMTLEKYFFRKPEGEKNRMAVELGITRTWLSLIINGHKNPSATLAVKIEAATGGKVKRKTLRPDIY